MQLTAKQMREREHKLEKLLTDLQEADRIFKTNPSLQCEERLNSLKMELRLLYLHKYDYHLSKLKWNFYMQGDRPSKVLARRVKQIKAKTKIPFMYSKNNQKIYDPQGIANIFADYYQELFSDIISSDKLDSFLSRINLPTVSQDQLDHLNSPVSVQDIKAVIKSSKLLKSPGPDGPPNEYYQTFSEIISPHFLLVCDSIIQNKAPPAEMLHAIITTIQNQKSLWTNQLTSAQSHC